MDGILTFLLVGLLAGFLAGKVIKGRGMGWVKNLIVGVIGAFVGGFLFRLLGLASTSLIGDTFSAFAGAVVLLIGIRELS